MPEHDVRQERCESVWSDDGWHEKGSFGPAGFDVQAGDWCSDDGQRVTGLHGEGHAFQVGVGPFQATVHGGQGDATISDKGFNFGVGLTGAEAKFQSRNDLDPERDTDDSTSIGISYGPGIGINAGATDRDNDGNNEYGLGFQYGPVSFQHSTEEPGWELAKLALLGPYYLPSELIGEYFEGDDDIAHPRVPISEGVKSFQQGFEKGRWSEPTDGMSNFLRGFERGRDSVPSGLIQPTGYELPEEPVCRMEPEEEPVCWMDPAEHPFAHYAD